MCTRTHTTQKGQHEVQSAKSSSGKSNNKSLKIDPQHCLLIIQQKHVGPKAASLQRPYHATDKVDAVCTAKLDSHACVHVTVGLDEEL